MRSQRSTWWKGIAAAAGLVWVAQVASHYVYMGVYGWGEYLDPPESVIAFSSQRWLYAVVGGLVVAAVVAAVSGAGGLSQGWCSALVWLVGSLLLVFTVVEWPPGSVAGALRAIARGFPTAWTVLCAPPLLNAFARHQGAFTPAAMWRDRHLRSTVIAFLLVGFLAVAVLPVFDPAQRTLFHTRIR